MHKPSTCLRLIGLCSQSGGSLLRMVWRGGERWADDVDDAFHGAASGSVPPPPPPALLGIAGGVDGDGACSVPAAGVGDACAGTVLALVPSLIELEGVGASADGCGCDDDGSGRSSSTARLS